MPGRRGYACETTAGIDCRRMMVFAPILQRRPRLTPILAALALALAPAAALAEISLSPLRQVISEAHPVATYRVSNPSSRIIEGRLSWIDLAATETGYEKATAEQREHFSAAPYLMLSPASFRLEPGASETITVTLKKDATIPDGERRSHLLIETAAIRTPLRKAGGAPQLDIGLGISTPVILRSEHGEADAEIGETRLLRTREGLLELETHIRPGGDFSAYGHVDVVFSPRRKDRLGPARLLKRVDNISAYIDAKRRRVIAPLGVDHLPSGVLEIRYIGGAEFKGRKFASRSFEIAPPTAPLTHP